MLLGLNKKRGPEPEKAGGEHTWVCAAVPPNSLYARLA